MQSPFAGGGGPADGAGTGAVLRPMGVSQLLDAVFSLFRRDFVLLVSVVAVVQVPYQLLSHLVLPTATITRLATHLQLQSRQGTLTATAAHQALSQMLGAFVVFLILELVVLVFVIPLETAAITRAVAERLLGRATTVGAVYRAALGRWAALFGFGVLLFLFAIGAVVVLALVAALLVAVAGGVGRLLVALLILAALVGAVMAYVRLLLATQAIVLEGIGPLAAMRRSWQLTRGLAWRTLGFVLVLGILTTVLAFLLGLVTDVLVAVAGGLTGAGPLVSAVGSAVIAVLVAPILAVGLTMLYYDHRVRREGFDLQLLAAQLAESPAPPA